MFIGIKAGKQSAATRLLLCSSLVMHIRASCHCVDKLTYDSPGTLYYTIDLYHCCFPKWVTQYGLVLHYHTPLPPPTKYGGILVSFCPLVHPSVCRPNGVHSVSSATLAGSISILHLLSAIFGRCVAYWVIWQLDNFSTRRIAEAPDGRRRIQRQNFD